MKIRGFQKLTLVDYPNQMAAILFTGGCDFRCPFCHNGELVLHPSLTPEIPESEVFSYLEKRKGLLDGVVVSGGEPTLADDLDEFLSSLKKMGYLVKLDTNGSRPEVLSRIVSEKLVDYVIEKAHEERMTVHDAAKNITESENAQPVIERIKEVIK